MKVFNTSGNGVKSPLLNHVLTILLALMTFSFYACDNSDDSTDSNLILGTWYNDYYNLEMTFLSNNTFYGSEDDGDEEFNGYWSIEDGILTLIIYYSDGDSDVIAYSIKTLNSSVLILVNNDEEEIITVTLYKLSGLDDVEEEEEEEEEEDDSSNSDDSSSTDTSSNTGSSDSEESGGTLYGHEYVNLGLSVKWVTCNLGASYYYEFGDYYGWGETETQLYYSSNLSSTYGVSMSDISGNSKYDAARANWGGTWRIPTRTEIQELRRYCTFTWTKKGGNYGYLVVSNNNGNSIFLPAAGCMLKDNLHDTGSTGLGPCGYYWTSTPSSNNKTYSFWFYENDADGDIADEFGRYYGMSIRPVAN